MEDSKFCSSKSRSLWIATSEDTHYPFLEGECEVDVAILGGGIAGISSAFFLKEAGATVAIIEAQKIVQGVTGNTTAKITSLHNLIYSHLIHKYGEETAYVYGKANQWAIKEIAKLVKHYKIDCDFTPASAYVYTEHEKALSLIEQEVILAKKLDLPAEFTTQTELPYPIQGAIKFTDQAHFHPRKYLLKLSSLIPGNGSYIFEHTRALDVKEGSPCLVKTNRGIVKAKNVIIATHQPFPFQGLYFSRMYPNRSYALGVLIKQKVLEGMYINLGPTIRSFRPQPYQGGQLLILGGEDHHTGHKNDSEQCYRNLEADARKWYDVEAISYRWSAQDNMSLDQIPYIGKLTGSSKHLYVATGFNEWGMTHGTLAGMIICDQIMGKINPFAGIYDPARPDIRSCPLKFISQNFVVSKDFATGHLSIPPTLENEIIQRGEGKIIRKGLKKIAVYRDKEGNLHGMSPICPHLKCVVEWNDAEKTWDCPCHGSRFTCRGKLIQGPSVEDLSPIADL